MYYTQNVKDNFPIYMVFAVTILLPFHIMNTKTVMSFPLGSSLDFSGCRNVDP